MVSPRRGGRDCPRKLVRRRKCRKSPCTQKEAPYQYKKRWKKNAFLPFFKDAFIGRKVFKRGRKYSYFFVDFTASWIMMLNQYFFFRRHNRRQNRPGYWTCVTKWLKRTIKTVFLLWHVDTQAINIFSRTTFRVSISSKNGKTDESPYNDLHIVSTEHKSWNCTTCW